MEAEGTREGKIKEKEEKLAKQLAGMPRIDTIFKHRGSQLNHRKDFIIKSDQDVLNQLTKGMVSSPRRKLQLENTLLHLEGSTSKRQRKFTEHLSY